MWLIKLTPSAEAIDMGASESIQTVPSDDVEDLFKHPNGGWKWTTVEKLLEDGLLVRVEIDFIPTTLGGDHAGRRYSCV